MASFSVSELANLLPRGDDLRDKVAKIPAGVASVDASNPWFVEPDLRAQLPIKPGKTSVVLLDAPGAVGKSTVAAELASRAGAFLWNLAKFQVGSRTFSGTILELYDFASTGVLKRLKEGNFLFILDALDEAQVRAGSQNFDAFISDLAETLKDPRPKPCVVLLARSDTADWVHLLFEEANVPLARYQIEYFEKSQAVSFIEKRLDYRRSRKGPPFHRQQRGPFSEALSLLLGLVYQLFDVPEEDAWDDSRVKNFLGYAPVLEALTDYVDVSNYMNLIQELRDNAGAARDPWQFLADIVSRLLLREQDKVQEAVKAQLETAARQSGWSEWRRLYATEEQCSRVLGQVLRVPVDPLGRLLPTPVAAQYEDALTTILPQHPFLSGKGFANVVFKEFIYAWGVTHGGAPLLEWLRGALRDRHEPFLPSELFSRFIVNVEGNGPPVVDGQDFGVVYESFLSRAKEVELTLLQAEDRIQASVTLGGETDSEIEVDVLDTGAGVHFWRRLSNGDVEVRGAVRLGLPGQRFLLGPSTDLICGQLSVGCEDLEVNAAGTVSLRASSYVPGPQNLNLRVRSPSGGRLAVLWPEMGHPWVSFRASETEGPFELAQTAKGNALRKLIMMFRRQRTRKERAVRQARWAPEEHVVRNELLELAFRKGVLRDVPGHETVELTSGYDSLRTLLEDVPSLSSEARQFVAEYLGSSEATRLLDRGQR